MGTVKLEHRWTENVVRASQTRDGCNVNPNKFVTRGSEPGECIKERTCLWILPVSKQGHTPRRFTLREPIKLLFGTGSND